MPTSAPEERRRFVEQIKEEALKERLKKNVAGINESSNGSYKNAERPSSSIQRDIPIPRPPFWGSHVIKRIGIEDIAACMDLKTVYRLHWGGKVHGEDFTRLVEQEFRPRLDRMLLEARQQRYLQPRVVYGYFPCQSSGNELIIYDPQEYAEGNGKLKEIVRFRFPRQHQHERLCLAGYFASVDSGRGYVVSFEVVTMGQSASEAVQRLQQPAIFSEAYYTPGLPLEMAEGLAENTNRLAHH